MKSCQTAHYWLIITSRSWNCSVGAYSMIHYSWRTGMKKRELLHTSCLNSWTWRSMLVRKRILGIFIIPHLPLWQCIFRLGFVGRNECITAVSIARLLAVVWLTKTCMIWWVVVWWILARAVGVGWCARRVGRTQRVEHLPEISESPSGEKHSDHWHRKDKRIMRPKSERKANRWW